MRRNRTLVALRSQSWVLLLVAVGCSLGSLDDLRAGKEPAGPGGGGAGGEAPTGACAKCPFDHAVCALGAEGECTLLACLPDFGDCNDDERDGCETSVVRDPRACGACKNDCTDADPAAVWKCTAGDCVRTNCAAGTADCDDNPSDCEVDSNQDEANCGYCGRSCALDHADAECSAGECRIVECRTSWVDCDGLPANGCEATFTAPETCGSCQNRCALDHATAGCSAGTCTIAACATNYRDCDERAETGCEVDVTTNSLHCGGCNVKCSSGQSCVAGKCSGQCTGYGC